VDVMEDIAKRLKTVLERKMFLDDFKVLDKQVRHLGRRLQEVDPTVNEDLIILHESLEGNVTEIKKVLRSNDLF